MLVYTAITPVYKSKLVHTVESISLLNLIVLTGSTLYIGGGQVIFVEISIAFAFIQFMIIIIVSLVKTFYSMSPKCMKKNGYRLIHQEMNSSDEMFHERVEDPDIHIQDVHTLRNTVDTY